MFTNLNNSHSARILSTHCFWRSLNKHLFFLERCTKKSKMMLKSERLHIFKHSILFLQNWDGKGLIRYILATLQKDRQYCSLPYLVQQLGKRGRWWIEPISSGPPVTSPSTSLLPMGDRGGSGAVCERCQDTNELCNWRNVREHSMAGTRRHNTGKSSARFPR